MPAPARRTTGLAARRAEKAGRYRGGGRYRGSDVRRKGFGASAPAAVPRPLPRPFGPRCRGGVCQEKGQARTWKDNPAMELRSVDPRTLKANPNNPRRTAANTQMDELRWPPSAGQETG